VAEKVNALRVRWLEVYSEALVAGVAKPTTKAIEPIRAMSLLMIPHEVNLT
jgi:hypothetical protein